MEVQGITTYEDADAARKLAEWRADPVLFVRAQFGIEPDEWQLEALRLAARADRDKWRVAMSACAGPGKSAVLAWLGWWILTCHGTEHDRPQGVAISMSAENLRSGLWKELAKWRKRSALLTELFEWTASRIYAREDPQTWFLEARAWPKKANPDEQGETLSGIHARWIFFLIDEAGSIPPIVGKRAEQAMGEPGGCGWTLMAGNPTSKNSLLYRASRDIEAWDCVYITADPDDPKRTPRVSVEHAQRLIDADGRDDPWVQSYVLGRFPDAAVNELLGLEDVNLAMERNPLEASWEWAPRILGVDVAGEGFDRSVIFPRQGTVAFKPTILPRSTDDVEGAGWVARVAREWKADRIFIDAGGGYAQGWISRLNDMGWRPVPINFSSTPIDPHYGNKRSEMYWTLRRWVLEGGSLPRESSLVPELTEPTYTMKPHRGVDALFLESKDKIRERIGRSPDVADALALTFAHPVKAKDGYVEGRTYRGLKPPTRYAEVDPNDDD